VRAVILIRILVGWVFVSEGIQKFLFPATLGWGRFAQIGIPHAHILAPVVGAVEILCGALVILGLQTRAACVPLLVVIGVAILRHQGVWPMLHEARVDFSMVLGLLFLLTVGAGSWGVGGKPKLRI
jgi:putative oxidoreductase